MKGISLFVPSLLGAGDGHFRGIKRAVLVALLHVFLFSAHAFPQQNNPIVDIQQKLIEQTIYYFNEINTVCLRGSDTEAQLTSEQARWLVRCLLDRYREGHTVWSNLNQELIDQVHEISMNSLDAFVPAVATDAKGREKQVNFIASAYNRIAHWYRLMGETVNQLHAAGIINEERHKRIIEQFNESLVKISAAGREAIAILGEQKQQAPQQVRAVISKALEMITKPAQQDMAQLAEQVFEARIEFERGFERELKQGLDIAERQTNYAPLVREYLGTVKASFSALRNQAWQVWADLRPAEKPKGSN